MINAIINGIFSLLQILLAVVLAPIDLLLANIPSLNTAAQSVVTFRSIVSSALNWVGDFFNVFPLFASAFFGFVTAWLFFSNASRAIHLIKMTYNWVQKIKFW